jgi:small-conductance mechanosensitive channel
VSELSGIASSLGRFLPLLVTAALVASSLALINIALKRRWKDKPDAQFQFQLIMMTLTFIGVLLVVVSLPIDDALRGQLLSLIGLLLSAAIALSSTTFIGNIMAGIMLKVIHSARPGDWITVGEITGRISEMDLLHTEVQTEFRDLVTVPNLTMVTQPLHVVRASGTIISAEVSLGYDVPNSVAREVLCEAAGQAGLTDVFAQVRELGDFSVTYRVAGLLTDVQSLISARSTLRISMLDALHAAGIEIVSPTFMNTLQRTAESRVIPAVPVAPQAESKASAEAVAFDKASSASEIEAVRQQIEAIGKTIEEAVDGETSTLSDEQLEQLEAGRERLIAELAALEERHKTNKD